MLNPVIPLDDYVKFLEAQMKIASDKLALCMTPDEIKKKCAEAFMSRKKDKGILLFQEVLDNIKAQSYHEGELGMIKNFLDLAKQQVANYKAKNGNQ